MHTPRFTPRLLPPKPRDLVRDTPPRSGDTSQCRVSAHARGFLRGSPRGCCYLYHGTSCVRLHPIAAMPCVCPCTGHPPRFTPRMLLPKPRDLVRDTPPRSGDTSQCRVSAHARGFLRGSPRGCCYLYHGTSCVRLHPIAAMPCVCPCTGHPPRFTPRMLLPKPRDLVRETPPYRRNAVGLPVHGAFSEVHPEVAATQTMGPRA